MIKRPFFAFAGLGAGLALGIWAARRFDRARDAVSPAGIAARGGASAEAFGERLSRAIAAGRAAAQAEEAELRAVYRTRRVDSFTD